MQEKEIAFDIAEPVLALGVQCAVFILRNIENKATDREFEEIKTQLTREILADLSHAKKSLRSNLARVSATARSRWLFKQKVCIVTRNPPTRAATDRAVTPHQSVRRYL